MFIRRFMAVSPYPVRRGGTIIMRVTGIIDMTVAMGMATVMVGRGIIVIDVTADRKE